MPLDLFGAPKYGSGSTFAGVSQASIPRRKYTAQPPYEATSSFWPVGIVQTAFFYNGGVNFSLTLPFTPTPGNWLIATMEPVGSTLLPSNPPGFTKLYSIPGSGSAPGIYIWARKVVAGDGVYIACTFSGSTTACFRVTEVVGGPRTQVLVGTPAILGQATHATTGTTSLYIPAPGGVIIESFYIGQSYTGTVDDSNNGTQLIAYKQVAGLSSFQFASLGESFPNTQNPQQGYLYSTYANYKSLSAQTSATVIWVGPLVGVPNSVEPIQVAQPARKPQKPEDIYVPSVTVTSILTYLSSAVSAIGTALQNAGSGSFSASSVVSASLSLMGAYVLRGHNLISSPVTASKLYNVVTYSQKTSIVSASKTLKTAVVSLVTAAITGKLKVSSKVSALASGTSTGKTALTAKPKSSASSTASAFAAYASASTFRATATAVATGLARFMLTVSAKATSATQAPIKLSATLKNHASSATTARLLTASTYTNAAVSVVTALRNYGTLFNGKSTSSASPTANIAVGEMAAKSSITSARTMFNARLQAVASSIETAQASLQTAGSFITHVAVTSVTTAKSLFKVALSTKSSSLASPKTYISGAYLENKSLAATPKLNVSVQETSKVTSLLQEGYSYLSNTTAKAYSALAGIPVFGVGFRRSATSVSSAVALVRQAFAYFSRATSSTLPKFIENSKFIAAHNAVINPAFSAGLKYKQLQSSAVSLVQSLKGLISSSNSMTFTARSKDSVTTEVIAQTVVAPRVKARASLAPQQATSSISAGFTAGVKVVSRATSSILSYFTNLIFSTKKNYVLEYSVTLPAPFKATVTLPSNTYTVSLPSNQYSVTLPAPNNFTVILPGFQQTSTETQ